MKNKFSTKWKASKRPSKQRKYIANAPLHIKAKLVNVNLSKPLREKLKKRHIQIKKDDKIKIERGKFKGKEGKVLKVDIKHSKIIIEGINIKKMDGSQTSVRFKPSNLQIIELSERKTKKEEETKEVKASKPESKENKKEIKK
jgi:large subunit ribosomal protein L24